MGFRDTTDERLRATLEHSNMRRPWNIAACGDAATLEHSNMQRPWTITLCGGLWNSATQKLRNAETQKLRTPNSKLRSSEVQMYCARILIESARFPPFGFDTAEISSNSNENMSFLRKDLHIMRRSSFVTRRSSLVPRGAGSGKPLCLPYLPYLLTLLTLLILLTRWIL